MAGGGHGRLGPIETAIRARDYTALIDEIRRRVVIDPARGCWVWTGRRSPGSYAQIGRSGTASFVHRIVAWAAAGWPHTLSAFPITHHRCGVSLCVRPDHLVAATQLLNLTESTVRKALTNRISELEAVVRLLAPDHSVLDPIPMGESPLPLPRIPGMAFESEHQRTKRERALARTARAREENRLRRFEQVARVVRLRQEGLSKQAALERAQLGRSVFDLWFPRWLERGGAGGAS